MTIDEIIWSKSVSYTHLDVYKRQALHSTIKNDIKKLFIQSWDQENLIELARKNKEKRWPIKLIDSLDTLYMMDQQTQFQVALDVICDTDFRIPPKNVDLVHIPDLSTRVLGGLISAYELSQNQTLLVKAKHVADFILRAFDTPNRLPILDYSWKSPFNNRFPYTNTTMEDLTKMSLELTRLSQLTHQDKYFDAVYRVFESISSSVEDFHIESLFPVRVDASGCQLLTTKEISSGAHQKNSKIMKSIDESLKFIHCYQTGKILPQRGENQKHNVAELTTIDQPFYDSLVKLFHQLNQHDILNLYETTTVPNDPNKNKDTIIEKNTLHGQNKRSTGMTTSFNSKTLFQNAIAKLQDYLIFQPLLPEITSNVSLISSLYAKGTFCLLYTSRCV